MVCGPEVNRQFLRGGPGQLSAESGEGRGGSGGRVD